MNRFRPFLYTLVALASLTLCLIVASCGTDHRHSGDGAIWFVHATDPHIYKDPTPDAKAITDPNKKKTQKLDEEALTALFQKIPDLSQTYGAPAFLLITGDFGIDPCLIPKTPVTGEDKRSAEECLKQAVDTDKRAPEIANLADLLAKSPVRDIYLVAGNNDLPRESASKEALQYFNDFVAAVQAKLGEDKSDVRLYNLTACYADPASKVGSCSKDVDDTPYTLIGFPSQSFKNKDGDDAANAESKRLELGQVKQFQGILEAETRQDRKILIVTHIPELDDPYLLGTASYGKEDSPTSADAGKDNTKATPSADAASKPSKPVSAWNVTNDVLDIWKTAVSSDSVVAVFAGHLHDSHKEIYRRPYSWSTHSGTRTALEKLYLAPPLSLKKQENSVLQARGFTTVTLLSDGPQTRFYWYDGLTATFTPDFPIEPEFAKRSHRPSVTHRVAQWFVWLWRVNTDLDRVATFLIALLTAFLTVVALWQIPPPDDPLAKKPAATDPKDAAAAAAATNAAGGDSSPFSTRFGKTIIAGLGGLAVSEVAKALGNETLGPDLKWYYIICFISFFFVLLFGLNLLRATAEALRSRVAIIHYPLARVPRPKRKAGDGVHEGHEKKEKPTPVRDGLAYWFLRILQWFFSLRVPVLTFFDTFINLIQGKNQTTTLAFSNELIEQQRNVIRVADNIRKKLQGRIQATLELAAAEDAAKATAKATVAAKAAAEAAVAAQQNPAPAQPPNPPTPRVGQVRVAISVLSLDQTNVFYISRTTGSSLTPFPKVSVAWVSVFTGLIRWYESFYQGRNIILFDNTDGTIPGVPSPLRLDDYYENRHADYQAFVVIPVPHPQRSFDSKYVKGAIHISFATDKEFTRIWDQPVNGKGIHVVLPKDPVAAAPVPLTAVPLAPAPVPVVAQPPAPAPAVPTQPAPAPPAAPVAAAPVAATPPAPGAPAQPDAVVQSAYYPDPDHVLDGWCSKTEIETALNDAVAVLGELLHGFNEIIYKNYIQPNQGD
jgi:hypothetical protein